MMVESGPGSSLVLSSSSWSENSGGGALVSECSESPPGVLAATVKGCSFVDHTG